MCEKPILAAARHASGYDFSDLLSGVKDVLIDSDLVVGNLETPLAGEAMGYVSNYYEMNAPDSFADTLKNIGITVVTTANNHCLDRGVDGMLRTLDVLDEKGILHTGTFRSAAENRPLIVEKNGERMAFISCTYGTNEHRIKVCEAAGQINRLRSFGEKQYIHSAKGKMVVKYIRSAIKKTLGEDVLAWMDVALRNTACNIRSDDFIDLETLNQSLSRILPQVREAQSKADYIFLCPHMGGQYNVLPGTFSRTVMERLSASGVTAIIGNHAHVVQPFERLNNTPCAFALGNFLAAPSNPHCVRNVGAEYSLALHMYLSAGRIEKIAFTILKIIENRGKIRLLPLSLCKSEESHTQFARTMQDAKAICIRITGNAERLDAYNSEIPVIGVEE